MPLKKITLTRAEKEHLVMRELMSKLIVKLKMELKDDVTRTIRHEFSALRIVHQPRLSPAVPPPSPISMFSEDEKH